MVKEIDFRKAVMHDTAKERYRTPAGAVPAGTTVTLFLAIKDFYYEKAYLVVMRGQERAEVEMQKDEHGLVAQYTTPDEPCVLWYWFDLQLAGEENKIFYGADTGFTAGAGKVYWGVPPAFQITVYDRNFVTPNWFKGAVMYQIFPDRFKSANAEQVQKGLQWHRDMGRDVFYHEEWNEKPLYEPLPGKETYQPCDYFGGDLLGIEESLDYFRQLGVEALYLNPVFEGASNHRYNTGNYLNIDPVLGTNEDFSRLAKKAEEYGIRILLDGVFSHTGDDSVYFNKYGHYEDVGAYQSTDSPYFHWYGFEEFPHKYKSWWGFETLPEVDETQRDWISFVIQNEDSVMNTWLKNGAAGYRLDVADELPDDTIEQMREELKHTGQENVLLGEVWEDATTKQSYGVNRRYALGRGLDSVMNYPFTGAVLDFLQGNKDAAWFKKFLVGQSQNYPKEMYYALMNLLSSHDVARVRTLLAANVRPREMTREQQFHFVVTEEQDRQGAHLQKLAAALQFALPGVPSIYYGDEVGMHGLLDPFNRRTFIVKDEDMLEYHRSLFTLRKERQVMKTGHVAFYAHGADVVGVLRYIADGTDAFGNVMEDEALLVVVNRSGRKQEIVLDFFAEQQCMTEASLRFFRDIDLQSAVSLLNQTAFQFNEGLVGIQLEPYQAEILEINWV
ncbi:MAG TPA: glycoside hydrolase family 13 protein [Clostridiales bacterium]|nr:glycoside hydrolase family 13 protein [Clostridiales bacterium]